MGETGAQRGERLSHPRAQGVSWRPDGSSAADTRPPQCPQGLPRSLQCPQGHPRSLQGPQGRPRSLPGFPRRARSFPPTAAFGETSGPLARGKAWPAAPHPRAPLKSWAAFGGRLFFPTPGFNSWKAPCGSFIFVSFPVTFTEGATMLKSPFRSK